MVLVSKDRWIHSSVCTRWQFWIQYFCINWLTLISRGLYHQSLHYGKVVTFGCKSNHKVVNFRKWFLCQFSPKTWNFLHGPFLTPQKSEDGKVFKNVGMQRGGKSKKREGGVFHRQNGYQKNCFDECYDICFLNICEKHPLVGENCIQSLKK